MQRVINCLHRTDIVGHAELLSKNYSADGTDRITVGFVTQATIGAVACAVILTEAVGTLGIASHIHRAQSISLRSIDVYAPVDGVIFAKYEYVRRVFSRACRDGAVGPNFPIWRAYVGAEHRP